MARTKPELRIETLPISEVLPYAKNARLHSDAQVDLVAKSIADFGFVNPCLIDKDGVLIAGHCRVIAAQKLGLKTVPIIRLGYLTEQQARALRLADNALPALASWSQELIKAEIADLKLEGFDIALLGFPENQLRGWGITMGTDTENDPEEVPETPKNPVVRRGDRWILGDHVLVCGDATSKSDVAMCLDGAKPHLMVTDPPYGVKLDPGWRDRAGANTLGKSGGGGKTYMNNGKDDIEARWDSVWELFPGDVFYVWCAGSRLVDVHSALTDGGFEVRQILIWNKMILTLTRSHYWWGHEHCLYGVRSGSTAHWVGKAGQNTVWDIPSPKHIMSGSKEDNEPHPAQKPLECMKRPIENNSKKGDFIYEPFSGSGTTIIACETTGRRALAVEIEPSFVQLAIERWQKFTGRKATLDGKTLEHVAKARRTGGHRKAAGAPKPKVATPVAAPSEKRTRDDPRTA